MSHTASLVLRRSGFMRVCSAAHCVSPQHWIGRAYSTTEEAATGTVPERTASGLAASTSGGSYVERLAAGIKAGDRLSISRGITLCESTLADHAVQAAQLLRRLQLLGAAGRPNPGAHAALRVGVSGPPGAGKSCLLEALGCQYVEQGQRVAVLAVDPSSEQTGGALLGDKLRMPALTASAAAYVRSAPARGTLGGAARATADAIAICEAAGYDKVLVETVGVGQSETLFSELVDCSLLLLPPVGGDEWQAMKRGIMEVVDIVAVNKADGATLRAAMHTVASYTGALSFVMRRHRHWAPKVLACSAKTGYGVDKLRRLIDDYDEAMRYSGELDGLRRRQRERMFAVACEEHLLERLRCSREHAELARRLLPLVAEGRMPPRSAANIAVDSFFEHGGR